MKLHVKEQNLIDTTGAKSHGFRVSNNAAVMQALSQNIYSDRVGAVVREVISNAFDVHDKHDIIEPFNVTLPTHLKQNFIVSDNGTGLSEDDIENLYTVIGESTKLDDEKQIGGFGVGCKSPFAYASAFTVTSRHDGMKKIYAMVVDKENKFSCSKIHEETCDVNDTGLTVDVPVKDYDIGRFEERTREILGYFPKDSFTCSIEIKNILADYHTFGNIMYKISPVHTYYRSLSINGVLMSNIMYEFHERELHKIHDRIKGAFAGVNSAVSVDIILLMPPSGATPHLSREHLSYDEFTLESFEKTFTRDQFDDLSRSVIDTYLRGLTDKYKKYEHVHHFKRDDEDEFGNFVNVMESHAKIAVKQAIQMIKNDKLIIRRRPVVSSYDTNKQMPFWKSTMLSKNPIYYSIGKAQPIVKMMRQLGINKKNHYYLVFETQADADKLGVLLNNRLENINKLYKERFNIDRPETKRVKSKKNQYKIVVGNQIVDGTYQDILDHIDTNFDDKKPITFVLTYADKMSRYGGVKEEGRLNILIDNETVDIKPAQYEMIRSSDKLNPVIKLFSNDTCQLMTAKKIITMMNKDKKYKNRMLTKKQLTAAVEDLKLVDKIKISNIIEELDHKYSNSYSIAYQALSSTPVWFKNSHIRAAVKTVEDLDVTESETKLSWNKESSYKQLLRMVDVTIDEVDAQKIIEEVEKSNTELYNTFFSTYNTDDILDMLND